MADVDLARFVRRGDVVVWGQAGAEPTVLTRVLLSQRHAVGPFTCFVGLSLAGTASPEHADIVRFVSYGGSGTNRILADAGVLDILPCPYAEIPRWLSTGPLRADVVLLHLPPVGVDGRHGMGVADEYLGAAIDAARVVVAEVNDQLPDVAGGRRLEPSRLATVVHTSRPPLAPSAEPVSAASAEIGAHVASLVEDGSTLQLGIGALPGAIARRLADHRNLGIHSGAVDDAVADLVDGGAVTNSRKPVDRGVTIAGLLLGGPRLLHLADRNPAIALRPTSYTHDPAVLSTFDRFVAINAAAEVDLTGQINAEVAGGSYLGAVGGAGDFLRAAARSNGGLPIVVLPSTARGGSRIVPWLCGPTSTPRADAGIVVTEHGAADLRGRTLAERRDRMVAIAHPDHRAALDAAPRSPGMTRKGSR